MAKNPVIWSDYPDLDPIRVGDTYYMVSTTMYFMPGCVILRSYDLLHWENAVHVYAELDNTPAQRLEDGKQIYGAGMWAASLRYHNGKFYLVFICNDTHATYLYTATDIEGPWEKHTIEGFYHDSSLLFDDDGRVYLAYGNSDIYLTELKPDLSGPLPGGRNRLIVRDMTEHNLGYEGTHFYKINGRYYLFFIHMPKGAPVSRTNACFWADSLDDEFVGQEIFADDMGYRRSGVAQGGIVDTPDGEWYMTLFQDHGAVGRVPVLVPMHWENGIPVCGVDGKTPKELELPSTRPDHVYRPLVDSDDFHDCPNGMPRDIWQWNHTPDRANWSLTERPGAYRIRNGRCAPNVHFAVNTLTQRTYGPCCAAEVTLDGSAMKDGDVAGLAALLSCYGMIGLKKEAGEYALTMCSVDPTGGSRGFGPGMRTRFLNQEPPKEVARVPSGAVVRLRAVCDFTDDADMAQFYFEQDGKWVPLGVPQKLVYRLDYFTGCRFGLFSYATTTPGGHVDFMDFRYEKKEV